MTVSLIFRVCQLGHNGDPVEKLADFLMDQGFEVHFDEDVGIGGRKVYAQMDTGADPIGSTSEVMTSVVYPVISEVRSRWSMYRCDGFARNGLNFTVHLKLKDTIGSVVFAERVWRLSSGALRFFPASRIVVA